MRLSLAVHVLRGEILESRHRCEAAVCDVEGRLHAGTDDSGRVTTLRSSAKPFQLLALVERGGAERWGFGDEQLAVMAASHTGSAYHRALVAGILERLGLEARHLACGYHDPMDPESLAEVRLDPGRRSPIYNNCSGKHAAMLALARSEDWPVEGYERPEHPVQQAVRRVMVDLFGGSGVELQTATDDCGVPVFATSLPVMARLYARLAAANEDGEPRELALHRIRMAMTTYPNAVGGAQRFSTRLMDVLRGRVVAKGGAEGLECIGLLGRGLGLVVKCEDGANRAAGPAAIALLDQLGVLQETDRMQLESLRAPRLRNHSGLEVGRLEVQVEVATPSS
jgi:L-asparaginase II